jgi:hypothetical protein
VAVRDRAKTLLMTGFFVALPVSDRSWSRCWFVLKLEEGEVASTHLRLLLSRFVPAAKALAVPKDEVIGQLANWAGENVSRTHTPNGQGWDVAVLANNRPTM